jgi:hypothetical protein
MSFDKIIKSIAVDLKRKDLVRSLLTASSPGLNPAEQAYFLGLFFRRLKEDDNDYYRATEQNYERLKTHFSDSPLADYFLLKRRLILETKFQVWPILLFIAGLAIIVLGIARHFDGEVTILRYWKGTTYMTGLLGIIFGLTMIWISTSIIRAAIKKRLFIKKYLSKHNSA